MNEPNRARLARALRWLLSAATLLAAGLLARQCAALNAGGGFSREAVVRALREIAWALWLWLALFAAAAAVGVRTSAGALVPSAEDRLKALLCRAQRTDAARAEETKRRIYQAAFAAAETAYAAALWFACSAKEQLPAFAAAWLAATACAAYVYERAREKSIVRETEELKRALQENAARGGKPAALNERARQRNGACGAENFQAAAKEERGVSCETESIREAEALGNKRQEKKGAACAEDTAKTERAASLNAPARRMERKFGVEDLARDCAREERGEFSFADKTEPAQETKGLGDMRNTKTEAVRTEIVSSALAQNNQHSSQLTSPATPPRRQPEPPTAASRAQGICRAAILAAAAALIAWGACNGGMRDVLAKAVNICTECIGLG